MSGLPKFMVVFCGTALALLGLFILFSGGVSLPTRQPPRQFHFSGLSLLFLGFSPLVAGITSLAVAHGLVQRESRATQLAIVVSLATLGAAFLAAHKS